MPHLLFLFVMAAMASFSPFSVAANERMELGTTMGGNQTLVSSNGSFALGFFSLTNSSLYLGIWYSNITPQTHVWVANRNTPLTDLKSPSFTLSMEGELQVLHPNGSALWSTHTKGLNVSSAILAESGNLVLQNQNGEPIWESFHNPGNTWLPHMTLGPGMKLRSWISSTDPQEGLFNLEMRPATREFVSMWNNSKQYWTSGPWNGLIFANEPEMTTNFLYNFSLNSSGFLWYTYPKYVSTYISRFVMEVNGEITQYTWSPAQPQWTSFWFRPSNPCDAYSLCGLNGVCNGGSSPFCSCPSEFEPVDSQMWASNAWSRGCKHSSPLTCNSDEFVELDSTSFDSNYSQPFSQLDANGCKRACLTNCSCLAYYYGEKSRCALYHDVLTDGKVSSSVSGTVYLRVAKLSSASNTQGSTSPKRKKSSSGTVIGGVCGSAIGVLLIVALSFAYRNRISFHHPPNEYIPGVVRAFSYSELQYATKNFTEKLGSGGFGAVFKGTLSGTGKGKAIAVKKLQQQDHGDKQFRAEVSTVGKIQHVNLVCLVGFCSEGLHRLLVYEHMQNSSLDSWLFRKSDAKGVLDWSTRFKIALGTAEGLAYLHENCRDCIIHCDIKPENILLDKDFTPKLSDFGLAKLMGKEYSRVLTTTRGTRGYLAPEWLAGLAITAKADVYSFGMTLLEIISGRRNIDSSMEIKKIFYPVWAAQQIRMGEIVGLVDERLGGKVEKEEVKRMAYAAIWCIQEEEENRPSMGTVVQVLEGNQSMGMPPIPQSLQALVIDYPDDLE